MSFFCFSLPEDVEFGFILIDYVYIILLCSCNMLTTIVMGENNGSDTCIQPKAYRPQRVYKPLIQLSTKFNSFFPKNISTCVYKNGHNSTCELYFFVKFAPLDSAYIELSMYVKNWNIPSGPFNFSEQVTFVHNWRRIRSLGKEPRHR